jgi:hypothetical protein
VTTTFDALKQAELASRSRLRLTETQEESAEVVLAIRAAVLGDFLGSVAGANEGLTRHRTSRFLIWLLLGVLLLTAAFIFPRLNARGVRGTRQAIEIMSAGKGPGNLSPGSTVEQSTSAVSATISMDLPGFVLQVAAMKYEDNADALAETLHRRSFPAFVFKRGAGPFYRVAIGVYGDADSAVRVKDKLERQGFKAILIRWTPE